MAAFNAATQKARVRARNESLISDAIKPGGRGKPGNGDLGVGLVLCNWFMKLLCGLRG
jgi:hypothetical protein